MDLKRKQYKIDYRGRELTLEVSQLAEQATSSVLGRYGDTAVLVTVVMSEKDKAADYFPLVVDYEERFYAAGKIMGSRFIRREGRPSEEAVLSGRLVDRTIRPLFDHRMRRDVQVVVTILQYDEQNDPDFITLISASAALAISEVPWGGPVAGVKIAKKNGDYIVNPANEQLKSGDWEFQAFVAGTEDRINMIELEGKEASEKDVVRAFEQAQKEIKSLIEFQQKIVREIGKPKVKVQLAESDEELSRKIKNFLKDRLEAAVYQKDKTLREAKTAALKNELKEYLISEGVEDKNLAAADHLFDEEIDDLIHQKIIVEEKRPDGRQLDEVRDLHGETGLLKRTHGSALFIRGNTQALAVTTLAAPGAEQLVETVEFSGKRRFLLHYNFPPYCTGEIGRFGAPGRREIGHGALAEKALRNLIPSQDKFPYIIRVVSEILSSNGSSSMATVCAGALSLMDAGVPIKKPAAGIAMGLMIRNQSPFGGSPEGGEPGTRNRESGIGNRDYKILTDIQGPEDHHGDMDCKVAGTADGVTAIQMDVKIKGLTSEILAEVLAQAKKARLEILKFMSKILAAPRKELSPYAPVILTIQIDPLRIGELIGPGGKTINGIIAKTGGTATIEIEESGKVFIGGPTREVASAAHREVTALFKEYKIGEIVEGKVVKILDFGAIVEFDNRDGMIHVSELKDGYVKKVEDVVKIGDRVWAKILRIEEGKIGLSLKGIPQSLSNKK
jgi:polyribonucleotide nucleotidyltransferase